MDGPVVVLGAGESDPALAVARVAEVLRSGGTVLVPTDTVYGVAALASDPRAAERLAALKGRSVDQPLAVLVADRAQAATLAAPAPAPEVERWMAEHWPGPLTLVLRRLPEAAALDLGGDPTTIGVRCPDHAFVRALAAEVGPLATTSANRHGEPTPTGAAEAAASLVADVALVVDGGPAGTVASTVVDATVRPPRILRVGAVEPAVLGC
jgi:L-threonylcarbamoyladenylate synthase